MTRRDARALTNKIVRMADNDPEMYIKRYGPMWFRVMTSSHAPIMNIPKMLMQAEYLGGKVRQEGLIYKFL